MEVEIVQDDLSEIEAFELEEQLVEEYGGAAADDGELTNWIPGGECPASITIEFPFDDSGWSTAYYEAREFKILPRKDQEAIATFASNALKPLMQELSDFQDEADERDDDKLFGSASNVESIIGAVSENASDLISRRVSWKDFGIAIERALDDLESEMENVEEHHLKVTPLLEQALLAISEFFIKIDSGNRKEAEELANRTVQDK